MSNESSNALSALSDKMAMYADFHKEEDKANNGLLTKVSKIVTALATVAKNEASLPYNALNAVAQCCLIAGEKANG